MAPEQAVAKREDQCAALDLANPSDIAKVMVASGFFKDVRSFSQAIVKVQAGRELGLGAFAAMEAFDVIEGKLRVSSGQLAAWTKAHPLRDYRIRESSSKLCRIEWFQRDTIDSEWESIGISEWNEEDAKRAGLNSPAWKKYPAAMMFNRCVSNGVAMFVPDIVPTCNRVYTEGDYFGPADAGYEERTGQTMEPVPPDEPGTWDCPKTDEVYVEQSSSPRVEKMSTKAQRQKIAIMCRERGIDDEDRHARTKRLFGVESLKELEFTQAHTLIEKLAEIPPVSDA